eukprot:jgi/Antlo1/1856/757
MEDGKDCWGSEDINVDESVRDGNPSVLVNSSWKKDDGDKGWNSYDVGWGSTQDTDMFYANDDEVRGGFLMRKRLGIKIKSIFDGQKSLTR